MDSSSTSFSRKSAVLPVITEKGESSAERSGKHDSIPRQLNFDNDDVVNTKKEPDRPRINLFSKLHSNDDNAKKTTETSRSSDSSMKTKSIDVSNVDSLNAPVEAITIAKSNSISMKSRESIIIDRKVCTELETSKVKSDGIDSRQQPIKVIPKPADNYEETPCKTTFQLPQTSTMRRTQTSSQHRTLLSSANQSRKCRTDLEKEFRSQKVLFTTPSAVSRPAIKAMNHLDFDDSLNYYKSSPMVDKNLSPVKEEHNKENKCPKNESDANDLHQTISNIDEQFDANEAKEKEKEKTDAPSAAKENEEKKEKIITINKKDFIIQNKIGHGGSSSVFLVEHKDTKIQCALKVRMATSLVIFELYLLINSIILCST